MFSNDSKIELAVLQERFKAHEQIIDKVDTAIQTLSETNQNICRMLAVHEERIEQCNKDDNELCKKVDVIETKLDGLYKFRWQAEAVLAVIMSLIGIINAFVPKLLTNQPKPPTLERTK